MEAFLGFHGDLEDAADQLVIFLSSTPPTLSFETSLKTPQTVPPTPELEVNRRKLWVLNSMSNYNKWGVPGFCGGGNAVS